jgi:hypothetical protein
LLERIVRPEAESPTFVISERNPGTDAHSMPSSASEIALARAKCCRSGFALTSQPELASMRAMPVEAEVREAMTLFVVARSHDRVLQVISKAMRKTSPAGKILKRQLPNISVFAAAYSNRSYLMFTHDISYMTTLVDPTCYYTS